MVRLEDSTMMPRAARLTLSRIFSEFTALNARTIFSLLLVSNAAQLGLPSGSLAETKPSATEVPHSPLSVAAVCSIGFEDARLDDASLEFSDPKSEEWCDKRSLCGFKIAAGLPCDEVLSGEGYESGMVRQYDLDNNGEVDCADYAIWKRWLAAQFQKGNRKNSGASLFVSECDGSRNGKPDEIATNDRK